MQKCSVVHTNLSWFFLTSPYFWISDSSVNICIEDCTVRTGYDSIALKSGWDEYGISYGMPTSNLHIRRVHLESSTGSTIAFGSKMSGGISQVRIEDAHLYRSSSGVEFRTTRGRGGYITDISISELNMEDVRLAFRATGQCGTHPDDNFDPSALPVVDRISVRNVFGENISMAGEFAGILESPFTNICLSNITLSIVSESWASWTCSDVSGYSSSVSPEPCAELQVGTACSYSSSRGCVFSQRSSTGRAQAM